MRIIAGRFGGRQFKAPTGALTHPMSDKMRGALFNILGDISELTVLDPFAGSGALSFEAMSRGAARALAIEKDRSAQHAIRETITALDLAQNVKLVQASAQAWLQTAAEQFDIVLLDPPYNRLQEPLLQQLAARLRPGGQLVLSWPGKLAPPQFNDCKLLSSKQYGDGSLHIYTNAAAA